MKSKKLTKRFFTLLLSLALLLALLPMNAFAESQPWANDAVDALNSVYGNGTFTADDASVTVEAVRTLLTDIFKYPPDGEIITDSLSTGTYLTRLQLAQAVCGLYGLTENLSAGPFDDCDDPAAVTLRSLGIVNGKSDGVFAPDDLVINAELAVIFYRTLGMIGAVGNTVLANIKPGEYGYDELMYLYTRRCLTPDVNPFQNIESATLRNPASSDENPAYYNGKEEIWNAWCNGLAALPPDSGRTVAWTVYDAVYGDISLLDAAVLIVAEDRASLISDDMEDRTGIFSDVNPGSWFYDGVMYLFNNGIVSGYGDGTFGPYNQLTRAELAVLMCRINNIDINSPAAGVDPGDEDIPVWAYNAITHAIDRGYMTYDNGTYFNPGGQVTRQEAALAIFGSYGGYDAGDVSLSVLDRFNDSADIGKAYETGIAYLVSAGVLRGSADGFVMPENVINRAEFGVLLSRVMMGLDKSKMHDYETAVKEVLQ